VGHNVGLIGDKLCINLFKTLMKPSSFEKFKNIVFTNMILIDITSKLNWVNLPKKLIYLNMFYKNSDIVHYMDKINKNIIPDNYDFRLKKIIENPFEMYKYLRKEKDFIRWTKFISNKVIQLYIVPISISSDDFTQIGKMIYLLFNITEQNMKEPTYVEFIKFCSLNPKLILDSSRINLKIRDFFPNIKANINLGFLAKQLTNNNDIVSLNKTIPQEKPSEIVMMEMKLEETTKKYYKYKAKYLEIKNKDTNTNTKLQVSETSSIKNFFNAS
jgi:hypothetical protein